MTAEMGTAFLISTSFIIIMMGILLVAPEMPPIFDSVMIMNTDNTPKSSLICYPGVMKGTFPCSFIKENTFEKLFEAIVAMLL